MSSSTLYSGNDAAARDVGASFITGVVDLGVVDLGVVDLGVAPAGISPCLSTTNDPGEDLNAALRSAGSRLSCAAKPHLQYAYAVDHPEYARCDGIGRSSNRTTGIESTSSPVGVDVDGRLSMR
jgi:hypothetical protein